MDIEKLRKLDIDQLTEAYITLRNKKEEREKEHKERNKPLVEAMTSIENIANEKLTAVGSESSKGKHGTCFKVTKKSVTTKNKSAFFEWLQETSKWQLADIRPAIKEVQNYAESTGGDLPPGVSMTQKVVVQFRTPSNK